MNLDKLIDRARASMNLILLITVFSTLSALNDERQALSLLIELCDGFNANKELQEDPRLKSTSLRNCIKSSPLSEYATDKILSINLKDISYLSCKDNWEMCVPLASTGEVRTIDSAVLEEKYIDDNFTAKIVAEHFLDVFKIEGVADKILELANELKVSVSNTVLSLDEKERGQFKIPILNVTTDAGNAATLFVFMLIWPYIYLLSVVMTIGSEIPFINERSGTDWIFFHTGNTSVLYGFIWLISPLAAVTVLFFNHSISLALASVIGATIASLSIVATSQIYKIKKKLYCKFDELMNS